MSQTFKPVMEKLAIEKAPGPSPSFSLFHVLLAVELIAEKSVGRNKLAEELGIGEGVARTMIRRLKDTELIVTTKAGCSLTNKGLRLWKEYKSIIKKTEIEKNELTFAGQNFAVLIKNAGHKVRSGIEQRDAAVRAGAKGATTILSKKGRLTFPSSNRDVGKDFPEASNQIIRLLKPEENDAIIIVSSDTIRNAEYGALSAAWTLVDNNGKT